MTGFDSAKVLVREGWLQGYTEGSLKIFKGVPYAAPPVGELRFRKPRAPGRWRGVRKAVQYSAAAIQQVMDEPEEPANGHGVPQMLAPSQYEEDCLYLNIWTPAKTAEDRLPVFLWVHGGGMVAGSGCEVVCDGSGFASRRDVIVVTINYRLGLFGFFAHPDLTAEAGGSSGNYALYDIRRACQWVKENIAAFGGDPERITVAGQSGGAAATGALHASPLMKGLIQRVSIESGPIFYGFMQPQDRSVYEAKGVEFLKYLGCSGIEELRRMDAWDLFDAYSKWSPGMMGGFSFCIDGEFLPRPYGELMEAGDFNDFDVMIGSCAQEFPVGDPEALTKEAYEAYLEEAFPDRAADMKKWYPASDGVSAAKQLATIASDMMLMGSVKLAQLCAKFGRRAYVWLMTKENETPRGHAAGSPHCAEMPYVFGRVDKGERNPFFDYHWVGADYDFMELIQGYWQTFCASGDPNGEGRPAWKPYARSFDVIRLGNDTAMLSPAEQEKYRYFHDKLSTGRYAAVTFGMPRFVPLEG